MQIQKKVLRAFVEGELVITWWPGVCIQGRSWKKGCSVRQREEECNTDDTVIEETGPPPPPQVRTHTHPWLFAEGISYWNVTIAMQSAPQLPNTPVGVRGKTFSRLSRQRSEIATRLLRTCGRAQRAVSARVGLIVIQYMSFSTRPFPHSPRMVPV